MKTTKLFMTFAVFIGAAAYACAESASTAAAPNAAADADLQILASQPLDTIVSKIKGTADERRQYIGALNHFKPKNDKDIAKLAALASEESGRGIVSEAAFRALGNVGLEDQMLSTSYIKLLNHKNARVQYVALEKCGELRAKEALPILIKRLKALDKNANTKDDEWRLRGLIVGLGKYGKDSLPELIKVRKESKDPIVRRFAEGSIQSIRDKDAVPQLMTLIHNKAEDSEIRGIAIEVVGRIAPAETLNEISGLYKDEKDSFARYKLIDAVGNSKSENAIGFLEEILRHDADEASRISAAHALEKIGGGKAVDILLDVFEKEKPSNLRMDLAFRLRTLTGKDYDWKASNEK